jgi:hypothetical protein
MNESSVVFWAAFGGAAAAGIFTLIAVIGGEWFRWFLDRPLVRVKLSIGYMVSGGQVEKAPSILFEAINPHTKSVMLSTFGLSYRHPELGTLYVNPQIGYQFPYKLEGGTSLTQWTTMTDLLDILKEQGREPSELKWVWFKSSSGKPFRSKIHRKTIRSLEKAFRGESS